MERVEVTKEVLVPFEIERRAMKNFSHHEVRKRGDKRFYTSRGREKGGSVVV
jgi:hypothetical protein